MDDDGWDAGARVSLPCEPNGSGELIIGGRDQPKLIERTK